MTGPTPDAIRALAARIGDERTEVYGYKAPPALVVAHMAAHGVADDACLEEVERHLGASVLKDACRRLDHWMATNYNLSEAGHRIWPAAGIASNPLLDRFKMRDNGVVPDSFTFVPIAVLSSEVPGVHRIGELPDDDTWRDKLADALARRMPEHAPPSADHIGVRVRFNQELVIRRDDPILGPEWGVSGIGPLGHYPTALIESAADRIELVLRQYPHEMRRRIDSGERRLLSRMKAAVAGSDLPEPRIVATAITSAHTTRAEGRDGWAISHYNCETIVITPDDLLRGRAMTLGGNLVHSIDYHDANREIQRLARRAETARSGGLRATATLMRCMERDGVRMDAMVEALATGSPTPRALGFGRDVRKVMVRNGVIDLHLELAPRTVIKGGDVHMPGRDLSDTLIEALVGGPLARLVDHPMVPPATITRMTRAKTGSLIARTDLS